MKAQILWLLIKGINRKLNLGLLLSLFLFVSPAIAGYVPPRNQKPPSDYTTSGGPRGCPGEQIPLTVLAPQAYVGHTVSKHPTFAWFSYSPHNTEFWLFEFEANGKPKQIGDPIKLQASKGINKYSLPENHPGLSVGKRYLWQVAISCPNGNLMQKAEFTVVEMSSDIKSNQPKIANDSQKAKLYAQQGLWYDALGEALNLAPPGKLGAVGATLVESLAQSEGQIGKSEESQELQQRIESLKAIANWAK
ncbi:hypothetical protein WA1_06070 [Scytonema hofmannii PCC 7110]|uniref:DUF928 domain-containing protein n=1 Tax=Scytonema hofmannii PCC 7110 TaxID=128403 RepID=A0A139WSJ0_9CYAN|nr:DUF928 domain-containing protein [Scytonema hofmannii]KYC35389.1 hypothetical protein WA1_06070 [Scytonema hofmannii PCC 7110]